MKGIFFFFVALLISTFTLAQNNNQLSSIQHHFKSLENTNTEFSTTLEVDWLDQKTVLISWSASIEGLYFEIEQSNDGKTFKTISKSDDSITKDEEMFHFVDTQPNSENYYRVMCLTKEGKIFYSDIIYTDIH